MRRLIPYALLALILDQVSKYWVYYGLNLINDRVQEVFPPYLVLLQAWNRGVNFGLFASDSPLTRWGLIGVALAICFWVVFWVRRGMNRLGTAFAGLLIGGALGNVLDRLIHGAVMDFLNMSCCGINNPTAFNVADVFIFVGAFGLILFARDENAP